ncbi:hypothetical protein HDF16_003197 [Granulicella aggregans]|uniref:Uncharacterized protein n=1 Tax=Granulicella aggregans TaxID=474949 RepID=A0A7W7ZEZ7_9BACT|nr:hypothetical protein [Granulicella aggregans]MBB5058483.1 hypothetical protein [Granulicella aggregans]
MDTGKKAAIGATVVLILAVGARVGMIYKSRHEEAKPVEVAQAKMDPDDLVFFKQMRPDSMKDIKDLVGKTIWVSAGGQMDYFKYANHKADYSKSAGILLGADPLIVKDAFEQVAPKSATYRIPGGDRQVLLVITLPKSSDPAAEYAVPVGYRDAGTYTFLTDQIFFYDDPHTLYKWPAEDWAAVDAHKVILGMSERQVSLSLGQVSKSQSQDVGNRTVNFDDQGHPVDVTFEHNKVVSIH